MQFAVEAPVKAELTSDRVLTLYDQNVPLVVETDASPYGIAAILSHKVGDKQKPILFISRTLTVPERNYSHLEKEAMAMKFHQYLFGREFTLITDNKPLQAILNP